MGNHTALEIRLTFESYRLSDVNKVGKAASEHTFARGDIIWGMRAFQKLLKTPYLEEVQAVLVNEMASLSPECIAFLETLGDETGRTFLNKNGYPSRTIRYLMLATLTKEVGGFRFSFPEVSPHDEAMQTLKDLLQL